MWYNPRMNEKQELFADMLGIRRPAPVAPDAKAGNGPVGTDAKLADTGDESGSDTLAPDELDVQRVVVEEMAGEKAELEERAAQLETENARLLSERDELLREVADLKASLEEARGLHGALETKVTRMGRALMALRRELAEAKKVEIGGRRW